eukprot:TRINITY_DN64_c0_g1_i6.p1 TRINITY_DN64_c0_g1~~TRINITY_DN64_c0_g1_i6.p1  ORF type:complete len:322 (-),score=97.62 TRINITY_DN64_c0_g1_i6:92-1006(-)
MKRFLEKLFTPKPETETPAVRGPYKGPIVAAFQHDVLGFMSASVLLELPNAAAAKLIPASLLGPISDETQPLFGDYLGGGSEKPHELAGGIKASAAISGGRSFYRPAWSSHLELCGAMVCLQDSRQGWASFRYHLQQWAVPDAPLLIIINDRADAEDSSARVFEKEPTVEELAEKLKLDVSLLKSRPVRIVFTRYTMPAAPAAEPEPASDDKGKGKGKGEQRAAPAPAAVEHGPGVAEALAWLGEQLVVDSWAIGTRQQAAQQAAEKKAAAEKKRAQVKAAVTSLWTSSKEAKEAETKAAANAA